MANTDYYATLGVDKSASQQEIKKAFRKKAMEFHPDRNKSANAEEEFKKVNQAYEVLGDETKRRTYDQFGAEAANGTGGFNGFQGFGGFEDIFEQFSGNQSSGGFDDIFSSFFGGSRRSRRGQEHVNLDIEVEIEVPFIKIIRGGSFEFTYKVENNCQNCEGTGANPKKENAVNTCTKCNGAGVVNITQKIPLFGVINSQSTCPTCAGVGQVITHKCTACSGRKYQVEIKKFEFDVIPGIRNGETLKVTGKGNRRNNHVGDLYISVFVKPSQVFKRNSTHVFSALNVDPMQAIVGGEVEIATPYGIEKFNLPPGTPNGAEFVIKNKGIRLGVGSNKIGDLILVVSYTKPQKYAAKILETLKKLINKINPTQEDYLNKAKKEIK